MTTKTPTFRAPSPHQVPARWHGGASTPGLIVMHSTVSGTKAAAAAGVARFFATEDNPTSAHYVVDAAGVIQCVGDHTEAYHCGYNHDSIGIEMCDMPVMGNPAHWFVAKQDRTGEPLDVHGQRVNPLRWLEPAHRAMLTHAARLVGDLCLAYEIPIRFLDNEGLERWARNGRKAELGGITTHAHMSETFHESTHWDPGGWPKDLFMHRVQVRVDYREKAAK